MDYDKTYIHDLEVIQRGLMKTVLRVIPGTATAGCYAVTGLLDIKHEIWKRKIAYYQHVIKQSDNKWMKQAHHEQIKWGAVNNLWDDDGNYSPDDHTTSSEKYWRNELLVLSLEMGIHIPRGWTKQTIKSYFECKRRDDLKAEIRRHETLNWVGPVHQDHAYDNRTQSWWLKAKLGSIRMKSRYNPNPKCIMCQAENEDMMHMLNCNKYPNNFITENLQIIIPQVDDIWQWLLHSDRPYNVRMKISQWIHSRWKTREHNIRRSLDEETRNAGDPIDRRNPDEGTGCQDEQWRVRTDENGVKTEIQRRRGPKRKCKMKKHYDESENDTQRTDESVIES